MSSLLHFPRTDQDGPRPPTDPSSPPDAAARAEALDITRSFFVEAPAGSGKTGLLIQRYLRLLADESVDDPAQVLAITFTVKATAEMRQRVIGQLAAAQRGDQTSSPFDRQTRELAEAVLARSRQLGWALLEDPRSLSIRTIDSVCAEIAGALPVLTGGTGGLTPEPYPDRLYREAARQTLRQLGGSDPRLSRALHALLLHRDGNLPDCEKLLVDMLERRDGWRSLVPGNQSEADDRSLDETIRPKLERALDEAICRQLTQLSRVMPPHLADTLAQLAAKMSNAEGFQGELSPIAICRELRTAPGLAAEDLVYWKALARLVLTPSQGEWRKAFSSRHLLFQIPKPEIDELKSVVSQLSQAPGLRDALCGVVLLPPPTYSEAQWAMVKHLLRVLAYALDELERVFVANRTCDFTALSLLATEALRNNDAVQGLAAVRGSRLQHLLVDEMQDTSSGQYELLQMLTRDWDGSTRTVFLVGDPKQSIYIFRQARVERFIRAMLDRRFGSIPLQTLELTANFRTQAGLVDAFNTTFPAIFPQRANAAQPEEVPYGQAAPVRTATACADLTWHTHTVPFASRSTGHIEARRMVAQGDAAEIRRIVLAWKARPLPSGRTRPWSIAVLVRSRTHLREVVACLRGGRNEPPIPFRAVDIEPLGERQAILDCLALTRALLHPADRPAWFAVLRAPWCGLTLADLHLLAGADDEQFARNAVPRLIEERGQELSEDGCARLARVWPVLLAAEARRGQVSLAANVHYTWRALGADAAASDDDRANVARFFDLLESMELPGGRLDLNEFDRRLARLYAQETAEPDAVDLLTIHAAKGLEWDVVFVPALDAMPPNRQNYLLTWLALGGEGEETAQGILAPIGAKGEPKQDLIAWMRSVDTARDRAEQKRLLYVACTRAREELHLFGTAATNKEGICAPDSSLLGSAWPAVQARFKDAEPFQTLPAGQTLDLAATAPPVVSQALPLLRIPGNLPPPVLAAAEDVTARVERPDGSFAARSFGNVMHSLLQLLTERAEAGAAREPLLFELSDWNPRAQALLRGYGLPPADIERFAAGIVNALIATVRDEYGWWLLGAHPGGGVSESSLTSANGTRNKTIRVDRMFHAGPDPLSTGDDHLWIVDYKTGSHGKGAIEDFLARQREQYAPQLESYAATLAVEALPIRLALYFPRISRLLWWAHPHR